MAFSQITPVVGQFQQGVQGINVVDTIKREILGTVIPAVDNYWGFGEFMYVAFPASAAITQGQVVVISGYGQNAGDTAGYQVAVASNAANTGRPIGIAINAVASVASVQYGWIQISGNAVIKAVASVAAGVTFGIDASTGGSVNANSAGRQVLNAVSVAPSTQTVVKTATLTNGSPIIRVSDASGWFPGAAISGTGVSGTITAVDYDNRTVTLSANASAGGPSSVTATYTGFIVGQIQRPFLQGAIT
jgi:hypothetical protein